MAKLKSGTRVYGSLTVDTTLTVTGTSIALGTGTSVVSPASNTFAIQTDSLERLRVTSAGNIGIGSTSPTEKLDVVGTVKATAFSGPIPVSIAASATDVLNYNNNIIFGVDINADRLIFWDDSAGKLTYLTVGSGLSISGTTITASGGGGGSFDTGKAVALSMIF